jgi:hypothetical protein
VERAFKVAGTDKRARLEEVLLRIDAGTDAGSATFGKLSLKIHEAALALEKTPDEKVILRLKVVVDGANEGDAPATVTIVKATLHTVEKAVDLGVKGRKGEPFARTYDPAAPKMFEFGSALPPRHGAGVRAVVSLELECGGEKKPVRTAILTVEKKF